MVRTSDTAGPAHRSADPVNNVRTTTRSVRHFDIDTGVRSPASAPPTKPPYRTSTGSKPSGSRSARAAGMPSSACPTSPRSMASSTSSPSIPARSWLSTGHGARRDLPGRTSSSRAGIRHRPVLLPLHPPASPSPRRPVACLTSASITPSTCSTAWPTRRWDRSRTRSPPNGRTCSRSSSCPCPPSSPTPPPQHRRCRRRAHRRPPRFLAALAARIGRPCAVWSHRGHLAFPGDARISGTAQALRRLSLRPPRSRRAVSTSTSSTSSPLAGASFVLHNTADAGDAVTSTSTWSPPSMSPPARSTGLRPS